MGGLCAFLLSQDAARVVRGLDGDGSSFGCSVAALAYDANMQPCMVLPPLHAASTWMPHSDGLVDSGDGFSLPDGWRWNILLRLLALEDTNALKVDIAAVLRILDAEPELCERAIVVLGPNHTIAHYASACGNTELLQAVLQRRRSQILPQTIEQLRACAATEEVAAVLSAFSPQPVDLTVVGGSSGVPLTNDASTVAGGEAGSDSNSVSSWGADSTNYGRDAASLLPSLLTCQLPGCSRPRYVDPRPGVVSLYCSRNHLKKARAEQHGGGVCKLEGCQKPVYVEKKSGKVHDYCGKSHARKMDARLRQQGDQHARATLQREERSGNLRSLSPVGEHKLPQKERRVEADAVKFVSGRVD